MAQILRSEKLKIVNKIGGTDILIADSISFEISEKEWVNLSIPHGGGKSIIYKVLLGQSKPTSGSIVYNNKAKIDDYDKDKFLKKNITAVPEYPTIISFFTVKDWVRLQIELIRPEKYKSRLKDFYKKLSDQGIEPEKHVNQLTLLEIRKLEILFSYLADTILIICDDIDIGLNKTELENMADFLKTINKERAILTLSGNPIWNKYAKKVVRIG
ncbi:MAG: ATP-binding cassette domain-containing protein [bacterium]